MLDEQGFERLRLDYQETAEYFRELSGARFKLLALVPAVTGAALATLDPEAAPVRTALLGLFGFLVIVGIAFYDQRNTQLYDAMQIRAKNLEAYLGLPRASNHRFSRGGAFLDRPERSLKLFGLIDIWHDRGLAIVYSTALAGWSYLFIAGLTAFEPVDSALCSILVWAVPAVVWMAFIAHFHQADLATDQEAVLSERAKELLDKPPDPPLEDL